MSLTKRKHRIVTFINYKIYIITMVIKKEDVANTNHTVSEINLMIRLANTKSNKNLLNISDLAKSVGVSRHEKRFRTVINALRDSGVIKIINTIGNSKIIQMDQSDVRDYIDEQTYINWLVDNYFKKFHRFNW